MTKPKHNVSAEDMPELVQTGTILPDSFFDEKPDDFVYEDVITPKVPYYDFRETERYRKTLLVTARMIRQILSAEDPKAETDEIITNLCKSPNLVGSNGEGRSFPYIKLPLLRYYFHWFKR
jgi:hypothetical protein